MLSVSAPDLAAEVDRAAIADDESHAELPECLVAADKRWLEVAGRSSLSRL